MIIAISLGLYITERQTSEFKDLILKFESKPKFVNLNGIDSLKEMYNKVHQGKEVKI